MYMSSATPSASPSPRRRKHRPDSVARTSIASLSKVKLKKSKPNTPQLSPTLSLDDSASDALINLSIHRNNTVANIDDLPPDLSPCPSPSKQRASEPPTVYSSTMQPLRRSKGLYNLEEASNLSLEDINMDSSPSRSHRPRHSTILNDSDPNSPVKAPPFKKAAIQQENVPPGGGAVRRQSDNSPTIHLMSSSVESSPPTPTHHAHHPHPHHPQPHLHALAKTKIADVEHREYGTPDSFRFVKPLQTAFMSTGLLSKRTRNLPNSSSGHSLVPPDTPCKKPSGSSSLQDVHGLRGDGNTPRPFTTSASHEGVSILGGHKSIYSGRAPRAPLTINTGDSAARFAFDLRSAVSSFMDDDTPSTPTKPLEESESFPSVPNLNNLHDDHPSGHGSNSSGNNSSTNVGLYRRASYIGSLSSLSSLTKASHQRTDGSQITITPGTITRQASAILEPETPLGNSDNPFNSPNFSNDPTFADPRTPAKRSSQDQSAENMIAGESWLSQKFDSVSLIGSGEFSSVYTVTERVKKPTGSSVILTPPNRYAVKKMKYPFAGPKARARRMEEVEVLRKLTDSKRDEDGRDFIVQLVDSWEYHGFLFIMTEYCENGSLDVFLAENGRIARLDDWRVWKILVELALGIRYIHNEGFMHLDIKPANVFITFEGTLKIGDFGMATTWPAARGIEREGDREYIAPEVLSRQEYDKPADIFSFGLIILEIAANVVLPDNGIHWQKLRSGDLTDAGRLSSGDLAGFDHQFGEPTSSQGQIAIDCGGKSYEEEGGVLSPSCMPPFDHHGIHSSSLRSCTTANTSSSGVSSGSSRSGTAGNGGASTGNTSSSTNMHPPVIRRCSAAPDWAPSFLTQDLGTLDSLVSWMLTPDPRGRPTADDILATSEAAWVEHHRKAGAVVYEGDFGPPPGNSDDDMCHISPDEDNWRMEL
ncbi:Mitosis inhibitor protein kinase wee1 [Yarrowia sp. C11]|nr:Mitosis inhibitor protein kinase wee1 [Yarrowia sp. C11]KAG5365009.1 Mitosis inhibitor protein kinase wee1 [Yarrowia sp. E02]